MLRRLISARGRAIVVAATALVAGVSAAGCDTRALASMLATGMEHGMEASYQRLEELAEKGQLAA